MKYSDEWIEFKIKLLKQVYYFNHSSLGLRFFKEVQYFMQEKIYQKDSIIIEAGTIQNEMIFIVNGVVEIYVMDKYG